MIYTIGIHESGRDKMEIILKNQEISACINALDFYSRMYMGQYDAIDFMLHQHRFNCDFDNQYKFARRHIYTAMRSLVFYNDKIAEWELNGSLGIWSENTDMRAKNAYDMQQVIRYYDSWCRVPEGGIGRSFDKPIFGGKLQPLHCECIKKKKDEVLSISDMEKGHLDIMVAALEVSLCLQNIQINRMMRYYTDDKRVLELATIVEKLYDSDDTSGEKYVKAHITTMRGMLRKLKYIGKSIK